MTPRDRTFLGVGLTLGALAYPLGQLLTSIAAGRGLRYPKDES